MKYLSLFIFCIHIFFLSYADNRLPKRNIPSKGKITFPPTNYINNGSFETGDLTSWTYTSTLTSDYVPPDVTTNSFPDPPH